MNKYNILQNILDEIIKSAPLKYSQKYPNINGANIETINQARSRAYIHLYLMVNFGLLDFEEREHYITDGTFDGGIDAYFIDRDSKTISLIQSKFRTNDFNFETKEISIEEVLKMDISEILEGEKKDENGNNYNSKINQLQREISTTENIGRYSYNVIILANLKSITKKDLLKITGGYNSTIINYQECYTSLVFPVITGTFYNASDLSISLDLSNKNAGSKISYTVKTTKGECEITVLFIPTIELARTMYKYKNSILKFNPRSYLGHEGKSVNNSIRQTILDSDTNEFALFNNGVTMISDETSLNEKIGEKHKAQLTVKNPQIINGGQTSFTLSKLYEENINNNLENIFQGKEVLLKIITLLENNNSQNKIELINSISTATNQQTPVVNADKLANEKFQIELQQIIYNKFGVLYERKRGEFSNGINCNYIDENKILERNLFFKIYYCNNISIFSATKKKLIFKFNETLDDVTKDNKLERTYFGFLVFKKITKSNIVNQKFDVTVYAKIKVMTDLLITDSPNEFESIINSKYQDYNAIWQNFLLEYKNKKGKKIIKKDIITGEERETVKVDYASWFNSSNFKTQCEEYFKPLLSLTVGLA